MDLLIEKQKQLKNLIDKKKELEQLLCDLNFKKEQLKKEYDEINSKIKTSIEFEKCISSFRNYEITNNDKIIKAIITIILILLVVIINILSKNFFDLINFPMNTYFVTLASFVETIAVIDVLILKPNYDYKTKLKATEEMKKYILNEEEEIKLSSRIKEIKQDSLLISEELSKNVQEKESLTKQINVLLFELLNEEKIKNLIIQDILSTRNNFDKEINLIIDDFNKSIVRTKN